MAYWNDNNASIQGNGNLTLGLDGRNDAEYHADYPYAKNDLWIPVAPGQIRSTTDPALTRVAAGQYKKTLVASTTHNVLIPFPPGAFLRSYVGDTNKASPHGILLKSLTLYYRVNTADLTSISLEVYQIPQAAGAALAAPAVIASTTTGGTLTQAANQYAAVAALDAETWINTLGTLVTGEAIIVTPASSTCDILGAEWGVAAALY